MSQTTLDSLQLDQKTGTKQITFSNNIYSPSTSFSDEHLAVNSLKGDLNLEQFPNLEKITFQESTIYNLGRIDISKNVELYMLIIERNTNFIYGYSKLLINERQLSQIIVYFHDGPRPGPWRLKKAGGVPYRLVDDQKLEKKLEHLEAEVEKLKQAVAEKDQHIKDLQKETTQKPTLSQFQELNNIVLPGSEPNYFNLKQEIKRLKLKEFAPYFREQKDKLDQLTINTRNKVGDNLKPILELFMQTRKQIIEQVNGNGDDFTKGQLQGQLTTCQALLQTKITQEELQSFINTQEEILKLEEQSNSLKFD